MGENNLGSNKVNLTILKYTKINHNHFAIFDSVIVFPIISPHELQYNKIHPPSPRNQYVILRTIHYLGFVLRYTILLLLSMRPTFGRIGIGTLLLSILCCSCGDGDGNGAAAALACGI